MSMASERVNVERLKILAVVAMLAAVALAVPHTNSFLILLATRALAFSILVMSLDILLGFTGLASLGQAAYLGIGAYMTAILATRYEFGTMSSEGTTAGSPAPRNLTVSRMERE